MEELVESWEDIKHADVLGSIIKFNISASTRRQISEAVQHWRNEPFISYGIQVGLPIMDFILALTDSYDAIVMNPPYMATNKDDVLKKYAVENYPDSKADLFTVFMDVAIDRLKDGGHYGMINMQSWMFLGSFESLRKKIIAEQQIESLLHLGPHTFDELSGEIVQNVAFIISKNNPQNKGEYYRLIEGSCSQAKKDLFLKSPKPYMVSQVHFCKIPGNPIAYWVSIDIVNGFSLPNLKTVCDARSGLSSSDNNRFLRLWYEVDFAKVKFNTKEHSETEGFSYKWYPIQRGGGFRKWYGLHTDVINWQNNGEEIKGYAAELYKSYSRTIKNIPFYFKSGISWSYITSGKTSFRSFPEGFIIINAGPACFNFDKYKSSERYIQSLLNSKVSGIFLSFLSPTLNFDSGPISNIPYIFDEYQHKAIERIGDDNVSISKADWDAHETSWDFQENPLVSSIKNNRRGKLEDSLADYEQVWTSRFKKLHANEEELNRKFIEIYGLQDELSPHVEYEDITILQQGEINLYRPTHGLDAFGSVEEAKKWGNVLEDEEIVIAHQSVLSWNDDVIIKQLISYIVGCYMGRYRLDSPGLAIAHPNPTEEELADYTFNIVGEETFKIDPDAIIPVLPQGAPFYDNLINYISDFIRKVWGKDTHTENMNFIDRCLGKPLNDYLMKDFWKYHKKMYQNRPIYWEFASPKGAFRALVYAHRMDRFTVEVLRSKYLLPYINFIEQKITNLDARANDLSTAERRELDNLRKKSLPELREYHDRVQQIAAETAARETVFDLDDGIPHNHALFGSIVTKLK